SFGGRGRTGRGQTGLGQAVQERAECIEALGPEHPVIAEPGGRILQRAGGKRSRPVLGVPAARDQPRAFQHPQVLRDGREAHIERLRQLADGRRSLGEAGEHGPSGGIGERREGAAQGVGGSHGQRARNSPSRVKNISVPAFRASKCSSVTTPVWRNSCSVPPSAARSRTVSTVRASSSGDGASLRVKTSRPGATTSR